MSDCSDKERGEMQPLRTIPTTVGRSLPVRLLLYRTSLLRTFAGFFAFFALLIGLNIAGWVASRFRESLGLSVDELMMIALILGFVLFLPTYVAFYVPLRKLTRSGSSPESPLPMWRSSAFLVSLLSAYSLDALLFVGLRPYWIDNVALKIPIESDLDHAPFIYFRILLALPSYFLVHKIVSKRWLPWSVQTQLAAMLEEEGGEKGSGTFSLVLEPPKPKDGLPRE